MVTSTRLVRTRYISVNVDVDIDDILPDIETSDLVDELESRGSHCCKDAVRSAIAQIRRGDTLDAITSLEREFWPKWSSAEDSERAIREASTADVAAS